MFYTVYKTTNLVDGKFYMGLHVTTDPNDDYLGSGVRLELAIKKHGRQNFRKEVMAVFDSKDQMIAFEAKVVDEANTANPDCYNIVLGGGKPPVFYGEDNPSKRPEVRKKLSAYNKIRVWSNESRAKGTVRMTACNPMKHPDVVARAIATRTGQKRGPYKPSKPYKKRVSR